MVADIKAIMNDAAFRERRRIVAYLRQEAERNPAQFAEQALYRCAAEIEAGGHDDKP